MFTLAELILQATIWNTAYFQHLSDILMTTVSKVCKDVWVIILRVDSHGLQWHVNASLYKVG